MKASLRVSTNKATTTRNVNGCLRVTKSIKQSTRCISFAGTSKPSTASFQRRSYSNISEIEEKIRSNEGAMRAREKVKSGKYSFSPAVTVNLADIEDGGPAGWRTKAAKKYLDRGLLAGGENITIGKFQRGGKKASGPSPLELLRAKKARILEKKSQTPQEVLDLIDQKYRPQVLALYRKIQRAGRHEDWLNGDESKEYVRKEARKLFARHRHWVNPKNIEERIAEANDRYDIAMHYRNPFPRPTYLSKGLSTREWASEGDPNVPTYLSSYNSKRRGEW